MVTLLVCLGGFFGGISDAVATFFSVAPNFENYKKYICVPNFIPNFILFWEELKAISKL